MKKYITIILALIFIIPACKYDEGPFFSIYSKKERIMGNKSFKKVLIDNADSTEKYSNQYLDFSKNGSVSWLYYADANNTYYSQPTEVYPGLWTLDDDKVHLEMQIYKEDTTIVRNWKIVRLTYADFFLERTDEEGRKIRWELYQAY